ncbi:MAG: polyprenyl synthetase family protein [Bacillota bacterium]|jgi:heptaprenyl diphosphate synthase
MLDIFEDIRADLNVVEQELKAVVQSPNRLLTDTALQLINAGGKRLRPAFCLLGGKFYSYNLDKLLPLAVALELIHMATLVHDDVVDSSLTRRGVPTVKYQYGNKISTHIGDYLFAESLILIARYEEPLVSRVLADTSVKMCEGEIHQISASFDLNQTIKDYFYRISRKTALLIAASCQLGAVACGAPREIYGALRRYGHNIGMAFQITDDILDLTAEQQKLGKPIGGDIRQGIITLPLIFALRRSPQRGRIKKLFDRRIKNEAEVLEIIELIRDCGGIQHSARVAERYVHKAKKELARLPDVTACFTLGIIADFISIRNF